MIYWCQIRLDNPKLGQIMTCLISVLINFACELGQIMTRYDQILPRYYNINFEQCLNRLQLDLIFILVNFSCELGKLMNGYDFQ